MTSSLASHYRSLESKWFVADRILDYARLVVPAGNSDEPFHRWFHFKEAYSSLLIPRLFKDAGYESSSALSIGDPFMGVGTTVLSGLAVAEENGSRYHALGTERNPVISIAARAKIAGLLHGINLKGKVEQQFPAVMKHADLLLRSRGRLRTDSVTLNNENYFPMQHRDSLLALGEAASAIEDDEVRALLQTCVMSAVEPSGRLRRDGRALRFVPHKPLVAPETSFRASLARCIDDLAGRAPCEIDHKVEAVFGDARNFAGHSTEGFDWLIFSPPYPNNIDYTEVYKAESWALGCYKNVLEMREQRLATIRSHPSIKFPDICQNSEDSLASRVRDIVNPVLAEIPSDRYTFGRHQVVRGYLDDMLTVFRSLRKVVRDGGRLAFVVGNSLHGSGDRHFVIAADVLLAAIAELAGWEVEEIRIARRLQRRSGGDKEYLRESVVLLRPSGCRDSQ